MRASRLVWSGFANKRHHANDFVAKATNLKGRLKGKTQFLFAREEAQKFLDAEVPKTNLNAWMSEGNNALALSQLLGYFNIVPEASLASLMLNRLVHLAEDAESNPVTRLSAVTSLLSVRPNENYERAFTTVEGILRVFTAQMTSGVIPADGWAVVCHCAKVLQRCGRRTPSAVNERLAQAVKALLKETPEDQLPSLQWDLLRVYGWMVRSEVEEGVVILDILVEKTGKFRPNDFATLMESCQIHYLSVPLPPELLRRLLRTAVQYGLDCGGYEAESILGASSRMMSKCESRVTLKELQELYDMFYAVLNEYLPRVCRFLSPKDSLFLADSTRCVTMIVFAYELGGTLQYKNLFALLADYVRQKHLLFQPVQVALSVGILRRSGHLTPDLAQLLADRIEPSLGELRLPELSHVCATFATVVEPPLWLKETQALVQKAQTPDFTLSPYNKLLLNACYPGVMPVTSQDYEALSMRNLIDIYSFGSMVDEATTAQCIIEKLSTGESRLSPDEVRYLMLTGSPELKNVVNSYLYRMFNEDTWSMDTLLYAQLLDPQQQGSHKNPKKALDAAHRCSVGPQQFVCLVELFIRLFEESEESIVSFIEKGSSDLVAAERVSWVTVTQFLTAVRNYPKLRPNDAWLLLLSSKHGEKIIYLPLHHLEELLISLHTIYGDVGRTPELRTILTEIHRLHHLVLASAEPDEPTARLVVLLVYLQRGMEPPLLDTQSREIVNVRAHKAVYSEDVQQAVDGMPVPPPTAVKTVGRFVLRSQPPVQAEDDRLDTLDLSDDPFQEMMPESEPPVAEEAEATLPEEPIPATEEPPLETPIEDPSPETPPTPVVESPPEAAVAEEIPPPTATEKATIPDPTEGEKKPSFYTKLFQHSLGNILDSPPAPEPAAPPECPIPSPHRSLAGRASALTSPSRLLTNPSQRRSPPSSPS